MQRFAARMETHNLQRVVGITNIRRRVSIIVALTIFAILIGAQLHVVFSKYLNWPPVAYKDPLVYNLTTENVPWDIYYGDSPRCGNQDCYTIPSETMPLSVKPQRLPMAALDRENFTQGQTIFYRTTVTMPALLRRSVKEQWFLQTKYIWGDQHDIYINGALVHSGANGSGVNVPMPPELFKTETPVSIIIKINSGQRTLFGIPAVSQIVLMPKSQALPLVPHLGDKISDLFYLFSMQRMALVLVFCLLYLTARQNKESLWFALFGFFGTLKLLLIANARDVVSDTPLAMFDPVVLGTFADCLAQLCMLRFVFLYFRRLTPLGETFLSILSGAVVGFLAVISVAVDNTYVATTQSMLAQGLRYLAIATAILLAAQNLIYLTLSGKSRSRLIAHAVLLGCLTLSILPVASTSFGTLDSGSSFGKYIYESVLFMLFASLTVFEMSAGMKQRHLLHKLMGRYVDRNLADQVVSQNSVPSLKSNMRASILVVDLRSYTKMTEAFPATEILAMLNEYFALVSRVVQDHNGIVNKFIGDGILAYWPELHPDQDPPPLAAARAAIEIRKQVYLWNEAREKRGQFPVRLGMAITHGDIFFGEVGDQMRADLTVIGEAVNVCARLETLTKACGHDILISEEVYRWVDRHTLVAPVPNRHLDNVKIKKSAYRLIAIHDVKGRWLHHDPQFAALITAQTDAGIIECSQANLIAIQYGPQTLASQAAG